MSFMILLGKTAGAKIQVIQKESFLQVAWTVLL
jgi:hypothetical protein